MDATQRHKNDFTEGGIAKNILSLAIPLTVAQLTVVLYNVVDRAFIGHIEGIGRDAFTGIGLVMPVTYIITAFANLCGTGGAPLCSIARGRGDNQRASRIMGCSFSLLLLLGIALTLIFYLFHEPILYLVGGSPETVPHAKAYLLIYLVGTIPVMISLGMNPFINSQGWPYVPPSPPVGPSSTAPQWPLSVCAPARAAATPSTVTWGGSSIPTPRHLWRSTGCGLT